MGIEPNQKALSLIPSPDHYSRPTSQSHHHIPVQLPAIKQVTIVPTKKACHISSALNCFSILLPLIPIIHIMKTNQHSPNQYNPNNYQKNYPQHTYLPSYVPLDQLS